MFKNHSTPAVVLILKPSCATVRASEQLTALTNALNGVGSHIVNFDSHRGPSGGYEVTIFQASAESRIREIASNNGFCVSHRRAS